MIILDIETTGLIPGKHQMVSLGAIDTDNDDTFYQECRIYKFNEISQRALDVNGFTEEQVRNIKKKTPVQVYSNFVKWCEGRNIIIAGHNVGSFDIQFLTWIHRYQKKIKKWPFGHRFVDLFSVYYGKTGIDHGLDLICDNLGIEREVAPHNALNGALKEYECFKKLMI